MSVKINKGELYRDCFYHPMICTDSDENEVEGKSLIDGSEYGCSLRHCGVIKITQAEADILIEVFAKDGERGLMRVAGWTEEGIDKFMKDWR